LCAAALAGAAVTLGASACFGAHDAVQPPASSPGRPAATQMTIVYPLGIPVSPLASVTTRCPSSARRSTVRINERFSDGIHLRWVRRVEQRLTCEPAAGTYSDPAAACRALADLRKRMRHPVACLCALSVTSLRPWAAGTIDGKPVRISLDGCTLCGLSGAGDDVRVLMPMPG
jgi:hypothetical protein